MISKSRNACPILELVHSPFLTRGRQPPSASLAEGGKIEAHFHLVNGRMSMLYVDKAF